jgi:hypothetical protein
MINHALLSPAVSRAGGDGRGMLVLSKVSSQAGRN